MRGEQYEVVRVRSGYVVACHTFGHTCYCGRDGFWVRDRNNAQAFVEFAEAVAAANRCDR